MDVQDNNIIIVKMNDACISTFDKPIIGTYALATCIGILLYDEKSKTAIVAHMTVSNPIPVIDKIFNIINKNKLYSVKFKYHIILGYYKDALEYYHVLDILEKYFSHFEPFPSDKISTTAVWINEELKSNEFYFNAQTGKFVTEEIMSQYNTNNFLNKHR